MKEEIEIECGPDGILPGKRASLGGANGMSYLRRIAARQSNPIR
jgi:hypothetical protein